MMRLRSALLLVAFSLLASAATARAEGAWVLWNGVKIVGEEFIRGKDDRWLWQRWDAYDTRAACVRVIDAKAASMGLNAMTVFNERGFRTSETLLDERRGPTWQCLPDTVDPRGPKR